MRSLGPIACCFALLLLAACGQTQPCRTLSTGALGIVAGPPGMVVGGVVGAATKDEDVSLGGSWFCE